MKKVLKIILKEIGRFLGVMAIPTFALIIGLLGREGIQVLHRFEPENAESYIITAIVGYIAMTVLTIYGLYHEYYLPYKKRKEQHPKEESTRTQEEIKSTTQTSYNEDKELTYWQKVVNPCKNIMTVVIVLLLIRFITPQESWFLNIVFLGVFSYWLWCMYRAKKKNV